MNQEQPVPYKTDQEKPTTNYEVQSNGDVKIVQTVTTTSWWKAREFLSLLRSNEQALEKTKEAYSVAHIEKMKEQETEIANEIDLMRPVMEDAEAKTKAEYERQRHEGLLSNLRSALADEKTNYDWFEKVWRNVKEEIKNPILAELTGEEKTKIALIVKKMERRSKK